MQNNKLFPIEAEAKLIADPKMIYDAINCYLQRDFSAMKGFILEYGEYCFFCDLKRFLRNVYYSNPGNEHSIFTGITIAFFDIMS